MKTVLFLFIALSLLPSLSEALPAEIILIRHAEKQEDNSTLSIKGKERAAALVPYFMETPAVSTYGTPVAIYAAAPATGQATSHSVDTVIPLAEKLKLTILGKLDKDSYKKMADEIKSNAIYNGKSVLICWEHSVIPEIARAFGALQTPAHWPNDSFDRVWIISFSPTGKANYQNIPQRLMFGDSAR